MNRMPLAVTGICLSFLLGCGDTSGRTVELAWLARGGSAEFQSGAWTVKLERAEIGFGPLYLCAAEVASADLCGAAVLESLSSTTIDALDPSPQPQSPIEGRTGTVQSGVYDYAISWLLTEQAPKATAGAPAGHSAVFSGSADNGTTAFEFKAIVDVVVSEAGRNAAGFETFQRIENSEPRLELSVDATRFWDGVDFDALATRAESESPVLIAPGDPSHDTLVRGMVTGARPDFEWVVP